MSADIRHVDIEAGVVEYDSDMPMGALKGIMKGADEGDISLISDSLGLFIVSWPFKGEPTDPEAWDALKRSQFGDLLKGVMEDLGSLGEE